MIAWIISGLLLVLSVLFVGFLRVRTQPTKGKRIADYAKPQKAIVIIDLQEDYTGAGAKAPFPYRHSAEAIQALNELVGEAEKRNLLVIFVRHEFSGFWGGLFSKVFSHGTVLPGTPGSALDRRLQLGTHPIFTKPLADAFSCSEFEAFLVDHQVNEIFVAGLDAEYCVRSTALAARFRGYKVSVITDGILLFAEKRWDSLMRKFDKAGINVVKSSSVG